MFSFSNNSSTKYESKIDELDNSIRITFWLSIFVSLIMMSISIVALNFITNDTTLMIDKLEKEMDGFNVFFFLIFLNLQFFIIPKLIFGNDPF